MTLTKMRFINFLQIYWEMKQDFLKIMQLDQYLYKYLVRSNVYGFEKKIWKMIEFTHDKSTNLSEMYTDFKRMINL